MNRRNMRNVQHKIPYLLPIFIVALLGIAAEKKAKPNEVVVHKAKIQEVYDELKITGIVEYSSQWQIFSQVNGLVDKIYQLEGSMVKRQQALLRVKPTPLTSNLMPHTIYSPIDGQVSSINVSVGQLVKSMEPIGTVVVEAMENKRISALIPASHRQLVHTNQTLEWINPTPPELTQLIQPYIKSIGTLADSQIPTIKLNIGLKCLKQDSCIKLLVGGSIVQLSLRYNHHKALLVGDQFVLNEAGQHVIYVVDSQGKVVRKTVKLGPRFGEYWEILEGLQPGDHYITYYSQLPKPGDEVRIKELEDEQNKLIQKS